MIVGPAVATCPPTAAISTDPPLPLPDKPSVAVLPFTNLSGDPEREYFADGMVEDIIAGLSRIKWLFVIARHSSLAYKEMAVDGRRVGRELGYAPGAHRAFPSADHLQLPGAGAGSCLRLRRHGEAIGSTDRAVPRRRDR